jgi:hypothetical protein
MAVCYILAEKTDLARSYKACHLILGHALADLSVIASSLG